MEAGVEPSVGSVGDSYDNALAETINGLYKVEIIHRRGPWRSFEASSLPHSNGSTGSTIAGSWSRSATSRRRKPRHATTPCSKSWLWQRDSNETASGNPAAVQKALDIWLVTYNTKRPHQGRGMNGRTPLKAFIDGLPTRHQNYCKKRKENPDNQLKTGFNAFRNPGRLTPAQMRHCQVNTVAVHIV